MWFKSEKEQLLQLLEWFLSHDWWFKGDKDFTKLKKLNTLLLRAGYEPIWICSNTNETILMKDDDARRQKALEIYKELKGFKNERD